MLKPKPLKFAFSKNTYTTSAGLKHFGKLSTGGKMVRPTICELGFFAVGKHSKTSENLEKLKSLIEAFHNFCLLQDDCMDNANLRHGLPTTHLLYEKSLKTDPETAKWVALTVSDLVFFEILKELYESGLHKIPNLTETFHKMIVIVTEGQAQDLAMRRKIKTPLKNILQKTLMKTADYSITSPFTLGFFAGGGKNLPKNFEKFSSHLGMAYQIQDDLLDYATDASTGKDRFLDFSSGTPSFVSFYLYKLSSPSEKQILEKNFGNVGTEEALKTLSNLPILEKALEATRAEYRKNYDEAKKLLETLEISNKAKDGLRELVNKLLERKS